MRLSELKNIIREVAYPKNKYVQVTDKSELKALQDQIFDLIQTAYSSIGGHVKFKSPSDVLDPELTYWKVADVDDDPEIDVTTFGKNTSKGIKHTGLGHDGERANIKNLLKYKTSLLNSPGNYVEVSGAAYDSFVGKVVAPTINDEETVRDILKGKELEWHGKHPTDPSRKGEGWYTRVIGGKKLTKILAGIPG